MNSDDTDAGRTSGANEVVIGSQIWMDKNLCSVKFRNGDFIPEAVTEEDWENAGIEGKPAWCYYDNSPEHEKHYGILYNWFALTDQRGLAPKGWKIPSVDEWESLITFLNGSNSAGKKLKADVSWMLRENEQNGNGTNETGFGAYAAGTRNFIGQFQRKGLSCGWWSAPAEGDKENWFYYLDHNSDAISRGIADKEDGWSVRCVKE